MGLIPRETIEEVLEKTDIVDLISSYIPLKKAGSGYKANCPFHNENTPSFNVSATKQFYHCFGCAKSGNAISFVMEHEGLIFMDALKRLALKAGVHLEDTPDDPKARAVRKSRGRLLDLHRESAAFFHELVRKEERCQHARDYLKTRGFGREMAERWQIGWMPDQPKQFLDWVRSRGFTGKEIVAAGLAGVKNEENPREGIYVRFRDRLMFPIHNDHGDVVAYSGRQLKDDPRSGKYINSPETALFKKSNILFAMDKAKSHIAKAKMAIICEGQIDAISCHENGFQNAVAPLGTACTSQHAKILKRYTPLIVLCYDADNAGVKACEKTFAELAPEGLTVKVARLPKGDDPDTFIAREGAEAFGEKISSAQDFFDFKIENARQSGRFDSVEGRTEVTRECTALLATMGDQAARDQQMNEVTAALQVASTTLREGVNKAIRDAKRQAQRSYSRASDNQEPEDEMILPTPVDRVVGYLCKLCLSSAPAQYFLSEQFEMLHEAKDWVPGIGLLEQVLAGAPDVSSSAAVNAFIFGLKPADQLALTQEVGRDEFSEGDGLAAAERALGHLSSLVLQKRDLSVRSRIRESGISPEKLKSLLEEAKEIGALLRGTDRSFFNDELAAETVKPEKKPWQKRNWKG